MSTPTVKLTAPEPAGFEPATRASILAMIDKIDEQAAREQFLVRPADVTYSGGVLSIAHGQGQIRFASGWQAFAAGTSTFNAPATSTTYALVARVGVGVVVVAWATYVQAIGDVVLYFATTANPVATGTMILEDRRGVLPSVDGYLPNGVVAGTYGAAALIPIVAVDAQGRVVSITVAAASMATVNYGAGTVTKDKLAPDVPGRSLPKLWAFGPAT